MERDVDEATLCSDNITSLDSVSLQQNVISSIQEERNGYDLLDDSCIDMTC